MNAARPARRLGQAGDDRVNMAEAICDALPEPSTGLVTRDALRAELNQLRGEIIQIRGEITSLELRLTRHQWVVGGAVVLILGLLNFAR